MAHRGGGGIGRRAFLKTAGAGTLALGAHALAPRRARAAERPNIVLFITDQQHIDTIAAAGCPHVRTPAMDALVRGGTSFRLSYSTNPVCSPARSSILTGRASSETGVFTNGRPIRSGVPNLGQWLGERGGYETVYAGKWHLPGSYSKSIPGFSVIHTGIGGHGNVCDTAVSMACEAFIRNRTSRRPFLMVASFMQPHDICEWLRLNMRNHKALPYPEVAGELPPLPANFGFDLREPGAVVGRRASGEPAKGGWGELHWRYYLWSYYRHIEQVDGEIGRVTRALADAGRADDTLVLLTADHGEGTAHHRLVRKSVPYDEASRVPFVLSWPGRVPEGTDDDGHLVSGLDVVPTICDYAGVGPPPDVRGASVRRTAEAPEAPWRDRIVTEHNNDTGRMVRSARYKYVSYDGDAVEQLFDMRADPGETRNLAAEGSHAAARDEHRAMLIEWERGLDCAPGLPGRRAWWRGGA
ncbi:MAG: sulfatase family protein [Planctomycetota bacterium]|jgi:choline-sulfatase